MDSSKDSVCECAVITLYTGKPGSGKSLKLADVIVGLLARNLRWYKRTGQLRQVVSNITIAPWLHEAYPGFIGSWSEPEELLPLRDVDIVWDEIATYLDSTQWQNVPLDVKRFLQQHRKRGVDIYGTTQAFGMVDISMRRLVDDLFVCTKLLGSRNPSPTKPPVRTIWGLIWISQIDPATFDDEKPKKAGVPDWLVINKRLVSVYDTLQEIFPVKLPPLKHSERRCSKPGCQHVLVMHR